MPVIIESLKEVFGKEELSRTLNSQECIARGCALQAAMLSPNF
jgi:heat shock protein 4